MAEYIGVLQPHDRGGLVVTGNPEVGDIWIPEQNLNGAPFGMKVVCEALAPEALKLTTGTITEVLGNPANPDVAIKSIIRSYGLSEVFPAAVLRQAERLPKILSDEVLATELAGGRKDLRDLPTLTIDGPDAKDLDDALSYEKLPDGKERLYVHIADVTHYVPEGSPIDTEAATRGTSVYLVDRVIPMQPPALSNGICSLNPGVDRLTLTAQLDFNSDGSPAGGTVYESVIRSDIRGVYEDVAELLETGKIADLYRPMQDTILALHRLSQQLRRRRLAHGSLNFDFPETKVILDETGRPVDIQPEPTGEAHQLIEEFMIAANIYIARTFEAKGAPFIYRVHEEPNEEKLDRFYRVALRLGLELRKRDLESPRGMAAVLEKAADHPYSAVLQRLMLEAQAKARYDTKCLGHFGLALHDYCHFTSPIRRYPDLFIHRVIKGYLHGRPAVSRWRELAPERAERASVTERTAMQAERDTVDQKVAEYMQQHLGEYAKGTVSGLAFSGLFVRLDNTAEGMVSYSTMDDYYIFSEEQMLIQGERSGRVFRIGDTVTVQIARADVVTRRVDFVLVDEDSRGVVSRPLVDRAELGRIKDRREQFLEDRRAQSLNRPLRAADLAAQDTGSGRDSGRAGRADRARSGQNSAAGRQNKKGRKNKLKGKQAKRGKAGAKAGFRKPKKIKKKGGQPAGGKKRDKGGKNRPN